LNKKKFTKLKQKDAYISNSSSNFYTQNGTTGGTGTLGSGVPTLTAKAQRAVDKEQKSAAPENVIRKPQDYSNPFFI
jgi:hypothetical protein